MLGGLGDNVALISNQISAILVQRTGFVPYYFYLNDKKDADTALRNNLTFLSLPFKNFNQRKSKKLTGQWINSKK